MISLLNKKGKRLGSAQGKGRYDLPLNASHGTGFLIQLIALMTFLAVMALAASFALGSMTERWSSGLENKVTIEIPAERSDGSIRTPADIVELNKAAENRLRKLAYVRSISILGEKEIQDLIAPWLGQDVILQDIPLPGLISVDLHLSNDEVLRDLQNEMAKITKDIRIDNHESWLGDLLRLTGALQFAAAMVALIISVTTICAVAGAVRTRMALHHEEIELLHLMGASDEYITRQLQRHALLIGLKGGSIGALAATFVLILIALISGETAAALLPSFDVNILHIAALIAVPGFACLIAAGTARFTVLRALSLMP